MRRFSPIKLKESGAFLVEGEQYKDCSLINIPADDPRKQQYISYFIRLTDLENAQKYGSLINDHNSVIANEAFFIAALTTLIKCFSGGEKYTPLNEQKFKTADKMAFKEYYRYKKLRNSHYAHQSSTMKEGFAYLTVAPAGSSVVLTETPCVIMDMERLDYIRESQALLWVIDRAHSFVENAFDKLADSLFNDYSQKSRDELLQYGLAEGIEAKSL